MSIRSEINRIKKNIEDTYSTLSTKGVPMPEQRNSDNLAQTASYIPTFSIDQVYPIGSIYMSVNSQSPQTLFGGLWEQINDTFLLAAGTKYKAGSIGGEEEHTLTAYEMPRHAHTQQMWNSTTGKMHPSGEPSGGTGVGNAKYFGFTDAIGTVNTSNILQTDYAGEGRAHNNMPPYLTVYMWKRVG